MFIFSASYTHRRTKHDGERNDQPLRAAPAPSTTSAGLFDAADREVQHDIEFLTSLASAAKLPLAALLDRLVVIDIATLRAELRNAA